MMEFFQWEEGTPIEHRMITKSIEIAQKRVEEQNFSFRKYTLEYDNIMNIQRTEMYNYRRRILADEDTKGMVLEMAEERLAIIVGEYLPPDTEKAEWDINKFSNYLRMNFLISAEEIDFERDSRDEILNKVLAKAREAYELKEKFIDPSLLRQIEKFEMLRVVDLEWMHHLHSMDYLREGIQLRAYGQRDPLLEYKQEAHKMFFEMEDSVRQKTVENLFRVQVAKREEKKKVFLPAEQELIHNERSALKEGRKMAGRDSTVTATAGGPPGRQPFGEDRLEAKGAPQSPFKRKDPKVGRNDPCHCGSGKKYKKCCGK